VSGDVVTPPERAWTPPPTWDLLDTVAAITEVVQAAERDGLQPPPGLEKELVQLRHAAAAAMDRSERPQRWDDAADPVPEVPVGPSGLPEMAPDEVDAVALRRAMRSHGCAIIRGAFRPDTVARLREGIDLACAEIERQQPPYQDRTGSPWFDPLVLDKAERHQLHRKWVVGSGVLSCDSPRVLHWLLDAYEQVGLRKVVEDYLGEPPVLSGVKCTLRRVTAEHSEANWHQDGRFLGDGIRALNLWTALVPCGVDAPGLDIVPRRFDHMVESGTFGSWFDWAVSDDVVARYTDETPVVRPHFEPGDIAVFDDMLLHRTATDPSMHATRYSFETWAFAPSAQPADTVPFAW
jgi:hypothetical protein